MNEKAVGYPAAFDYIYRLRSVDLRLLFMLVRIF
jgi:hypothetical protein